MKRLKTLVALTAVAFGLSSATYAQEVDYEKGYNFIGLKGGAQMTLTHYSLGDLITPQFGIYAGRYFNQYVGARIDITGYQTKGGFKADRYDFVNADTPYKFNACTADIDLLMNMTNIINPNRASHAFNWNLLAGFGVNYSWDYDEFKAATNSFKYYVGPEQCGTKHSTFNGRLGTQFEYNVAKNFSVMLEADANYKNDQYNLKFHDQTDWQIQAFVGLTYKFGVKTKKAPEPEPVVITCPGCNDAYGNGNCPDSEYAKCKNNADCQHSSSCKCKMDKPQPKPQPVPEPVVKDEPLKETMFYAIRISDPDASATLDKVADWCKKYPKKNITISGYADKNTGNAQINEGYAKDRAEKVAAALQERGVDASRMTVNSYGDTVQPFEENDLNRCVIVVGE